MQQDAVRAPAGYALKRLDLGMFRNTGIGFHMVPYDTLDYSMVEHYKLEYSIIM